MDTKIDFLYLSEPDMIKAGVKDMKACVASMESMLLLLKEGDYRMGGENGNSHGCMIMFPDHPKFPGMPRNTQDRRFMAMPAYLGGAYQMAGVKWYGSNIENKEKGLPRSILMMTLSDKDTGAPLAFMSANLLSAYRTGGVPGVGAKYLARKDSETVAIIGPGVMGKTSLAAFAVTCPKLHRLHIKGRGRKSIDSFIDFVKIVDTYPYVAKEWVKPGAFISMPSAAKFDDEMVVKAKCVVDNMMLYEAWEEEYPYPTYPKIAIIGSKFTDLIHEGKKKKEDIAEMADIILGKTPGRTSDDEIIIYSVGGMPVEDVAWGCSVYKKAKELGIGVKLNLWDKPEMA